MIAARNNHLWNECASSKVWLAAVCLLLLPAMGFAQFVSLVGLPDELIVPVFLPEYVYGDFVVINYSAREGRAKDVAATLNGVAVSSGERVTLATGGENEVVFSGVRTSDETPIRYVQTFKVTGAPAGTPVRVSTSGGGGGGSGTSSATSTATSTLTDMTTASTTTATSTGLAVVSDATASTTASTTALATATSSADQMLTASTTVVAIQETVAGVVLTKGLYEGMLDPEVARLQEFLLHDREVYPEGKVTGYFGSLTKAAVGRFQVKYGIVTPGTPEAAGFGYVGPGTQKKILAVSLALEEAKTKISALRNELEMIIKKRATLPL